MSSTDNQKKKTEVRAQASALVRSTPTSTPGTVTRRTPRRSYRRPVGVLVAGCYRVIEGRSLSEGGVLISVKGLNKEPLIDIAELPVSTHVVISLILPAGPALILRGAVIYHEISPSGTQLAGIKFEAVPLLQRREIRTYVSQKQSSESDADSDVPSVI